jgi:hypothetical protein
MTIGNGSILGKVNNPTATSAQGIWNLNEHSEYKRKSSWPGRNIVSSGLTVYLDAADISSYPRSGSTWFDISGNSNHLTLFNSPTFSTNNGGVIQFNGSNHYGRIANLNYSTTTFTIMAGSRYSGSTRGRVITAVNNNWLFGHWSNGSERYYAEGWIFQGSPNDTDWRIYAATENYPSDQRSFYVNNVARATNSTAGSQGFNGLSVGTWSSGSEWSTCEISFILIYNRLLTTEEMTTNFNGMRSRFGI